MLNKMLNSLSIMIGYGPQIHKNSEQDVTTAEDRVHIKYLTVLDKN